MSAALRSRRLRGIAALAVAAAALAASAPQGPNDLPAIVFVSRQPIAPGPTAPVPGLGPRERAEGRGGRLMVRRPDGRIVPFLASGRFFDVSDPSVSYDGRRVAFAARTHRDSAWRIWTAGADGRGVLPVTRTLPVPDFPNPGRGTKPRRYDDLDPCWLPDERICFASTRYPLSAEAGGPVTNLFVVGADGSNLIRVTSERNGAEEPSVDPSTGRVIFARWWTSRFLASDADPSGITTDPARALPAERVSLWHAVSIQPDGDGIRLAGGFPLVRSQTMAYQPITLEDGTLIGVTADTLSLLPRAGRVSVCVYPGGFAAPRAFPAPPARMCSPAPLPDGRLVVAYDPGGRGDFGLAVVRSDGSGLETIADLRGTLELDPAALAPRALPPILGVGMGGLPRALPAHDLSDASGGNGLVRFDCLNVFANAPIDFPVPDAPPIARDLKIRFFGALARPGSPTGDTVVFLREGDVERSGAVHEDQTPADLPMFEQLVDARGHVLVAVSGPAHVPGFNAGRSGSGTKCMGCHVGHSAIPVEVSYSLGKRFNAAPSASVSATSVAAGTRARAAVDRRTRGSWSDVAWVARGSEGEAITLTWPFGLAMDSIVVYGVRPDPGSETDARVGGCAIVLSKAGRLIKRLDLGRAVDPLGTGIACAGVIADRAEIRPRATRGRIGGVSRVGLAEVVARARIPEE